MLYSIHKYILSLLILLPGILYLSACQNSVNPSLEESVAPYLELEAIEGASNTNITINRGEAHGLDSYFAFDMSNIETNGVIQEGVIEGWCLEWNKPIRQNNDVHQGVELYNTFGSNTWKAPNYLMSIKKELKSKDTTLTYKEIQVALWALIETPGFNIDKVLNEGKMPSRMMTNGRPNFDVEKTKQIVNRVRKNVEKFSYNPGEPVIIFSRTSADDQNVGGITKQTKVINVGNLDGWGFLEEISNGTGEFEPGPDNPPLGNGSVELIVDENGRMLFGKIDWAGVKLSDISKLSYSTYRTSGSADLAPSLQLTIDYDGTDANTDWQGRLVYEAYYTKTVETGKWQEWDTQDNAGDGNWWSSDERAGDGLCRQNNPCTWEEVLSNFPNATIRDADNTGIILKAGGPWSSGFEGNVDNFKIGIGNHITTYDFEPVIFEL